MCEADVRGRRAFLARPWYMSQITVGMARGEQVLVGAVLLLLGLGAAYSATGGERYMVALLALLLSLVCMVVSGVGAWRLRARQQRAAVVLVAGGICAALLGSIPWTNWPLRLSYPLARAELDELAARVHAGQAVDVPTWAGLFLIRRVELRGSAVCLWIQLNPAGYTGLVEDGPGALPVYPWSEIELDGQWRLVSED